MDKRDQTLKELEPNVDIGKEMQIHYDGKQFMIKIPKEVSKFFKIKKGDKFKFIVEIPEKNGNPTINKFEIIKNA